MVQLERLIRHNLWGCTRKRRVRTKVTWAIILTLPKSRGAPGLIDPQDQSGALLFKCGILGLLWAHDA
jgi:hypothetical protein